MKNYNLMMLILICFVLLFSCTNPSNYDLNPEETFDETDDAPVTLTLDGLSVLTPWGYYKEENASRYYPVLVSGKWGEGKNNYNKVAQEYPAFVIDQNSSGITGQALGAWIKSAIALTEDPYRIDTNRIYLTGFSAGGSGSYPLAKSLYEEDMYFAAIIRVAGQSQSDLGNDIAEKTAVWYHIGLEDTTNDRVGVAREALKNMRNYDCNKYVLETQTFDTFTGYDRTTITLLRNGYPMFKYSEYTGMGHSSGACYSDDALFSWLFNHSLAYR